LPPHYLSTPSIDAGGSQKMISISRGSRQPQREPWSLDRLTHEWSIALGLSIDNSSHLTYTSALNSYLTFCKIHNFPIEPTQQTLSFFVVYMSAHIKPDSVNSYLSGICNQLEVYFPDIRKNRNSILVSRTLAGCHRRFGTAIWRKQPLSTNDLFTVQSQLRSTPHHDEKLFLAILFTGFHGLFRLGELTFPDRVASRDYRKIMLRHTVDMTRLAIRLTASLKVTLSLFRRQIFPQILTTSSQLTSPLVIHFIPSNQNFGYVHLALCRHIPGSYANCATFSHQISQANPCEPPPLLKLGYRLTSFKPLGVGHQTLSTYT